MENKENREYVMRNLTEDLVDERLLPMMKRAEACTCSRCRADVRAYALNHYPAQYVVGEVGNAWVVAKSVSAQTNTDLISIITHGINLIKANPRH